MRTGHENCKGFISRFFNLCGCSFLDYLHNENECNLDIDDETKEELSDFYSGPLDYMRRDRKKVFELFSNYAPFEVEFSRFSGKNTVLDS